MVRIPFLAADASRDEAGYLAIGQQWHPGGSSLYGNYWVDRPPLLITIFQTAAQLGGLVPLRLIGCLATALVILGAAHAARRLAGRRAAPWAALTAAALCTTPLLGGRAVNGELLSAPFVVGGLLAVLIAIDDPSNRRAAVAAALAGASAMAALLVKQNMADVAVFACVTLLVSWRRVDIHNSRLASVAIAAVAGALVCLGAVAAWTLAHGTSLPGVFDAMYPFRIEAAHVMAASNRTTADARMWTLIACWVASGGAVIMAVVTHALLSRRLRSAAEWGLIAVILFDVVSVALGGSYWNHYLIQLVVPISVLSGVVVAHRQPAARTVLSAVALASAIALAIHPGAHTTSGTSLGESIQDASKPRDTIVTTWGHADVTQASGLSSPYPYLWSLPAHTLDPRLTRLDALLSGPSAPTWFVTWTDVNHWSGRSGRAAATATARLLARQYQPVARVRGHTIYLHRGLERRLSQELATHATGRSATPGGLRTSPTSKGTAMKAVVIVPTYNEAEGITTMLDAVLREAPGVDVLVVDDNSPDGTARLVTSHPEYRHRLHLLSRLKKDGLGAAYRAGFSWALAGTYDVILQMDADLSHPPERIAALLAALEHSDVAIGSRYVRGGRVRDWPLRRRLISRGGNVYVRLVLGMPVRDATAGFKAFRRDALQAIGAVHSESNGYCFQIENTWRASRLGLRIAEVPITFTDRTSGTSKMTGDIVREAMLRVLTWRWRELAHRPEPQ